jgi:hypothetical protein
LICILTAISAVLFVVEARHGFTALVLNQAHGTLGGRLSDHIGLSPESQGTHILRILSLEPGSPLLAYGAQPDDQVRYDRPMDRFRRFQVGEPIGFTLIQPGGSRHLTLRAVASRIPFAEAFDYVCLFVMALAALLFSFLVGIKQDGGRAHRALAMTFCALSLIFFIATNHSPAGPVFYISKLLCLATYPLIWYWSLSFALSYQPYVEGRLRKWLKRIFPWFGVLALSTSAYAVWYGLGNEAPLMLPLTGAVVAGGLSMTVISTMEGWRQSSGEIRERHRWLLLAFAVGSIPAMLAWIPALDATYKGMRWITLVMFVGQFAMLIGLAYAVLKHRVFDFEFAVSRMVVFSVLSVLLLSTFGVVERISSLMLHGGGHANAPTLTLVLDGMIALGVYVVFHHLHARVERWVERIFFHEWHDNEEKLRLFVRQAAHITSFDALMAGYRTAVDRFTGQAGCAIYLRDPDGRYRLDANSTLEQAPERIGTDHSIAVALRSDMSPQRYAHLQSGVPGILAVPMSHRGMLNGFVLIGCKRFGDAYRPDEMDVLAFAAHQVGLDLHALRVELLETQVHDLELRAALQEQEMVLMAGRRAAPRLPPVPSQLRSVEI